MSGTNESRSVTVRAPAKINVYFTVGARQDDGYHDVASLYQAVSLYEDVTASESDDFSLVFDGPIDTSALPTGDTNLAMRAAKLLAAHTKYAGGVALTIEKNVPIAGGMGGGSADAAATLVACDELWQTHLSKEKLLALAAELGADVPFALTGGTAVGTGRGDELSSALATGAFHWVLVLPGSGLSTPVVYKTLDAQRERHQLDIAPPPQAPSIDTGVLQAIRLGDTDLLAGRLHNDLQAASLELAPELGELLQLGEELGALAGIVSGSGPTLGFLTPTAAEAETLRSAFASRGVEAICATGPVPGARVMHGNPEDHPSNHLNTRPITVPITLPSRDEMRRRKSPKTDKNR
jgi:4-diphosphocytidyl-2-C-methyl-D-erythritol kinase